MSDKRGIDEVTIYIMCQPWIGCWLLAIGGWLLAIETIGSIRVIGSLISNF